MEGAQVRRSGMFVAALGGLLGVVLALATGCPKEETTPPGLMPLSAEAHDKWFPIVGGNHDGVACNECHTPDAPSLKDFSCVGCHEHEQEAMDNTHVGFDEYLYESPRCYTCHPRGDLREEIPHEVFPIRADTAHQEVSCAECHVDPDHRDIIGCTGCHEHTVAPMANLHTGMPDYEWQSNKCLECHEGAQNPGLIDHTFFPLGEETKHFENSCDDCHLQPGVGKEWDRTSTHLACVLCHSSEHEEPVMANVHRTEEGTAFPGYLWESASCFLCHQNGQPEGQLDHDTFFPIGEGSAHVEQQCVDCHTDETNRSVVGCTTCHENHGQDEMGTVHTGIEGYAFDSPSCLFCHPGAEPTGIIEHNYFPIGTDTAHVEQGCIDCHTNPADRLDVGCISCHEHDEAPMAQVHGDISGYSWDSPSCLGCHPNGEGVGAVDHTFFPIAAPSKHADVGCVECHIDNAPGGGGDRSIVGCTGCHEHAVEPMADLHTNMPGYGWDSVTCMTCHPTGQTPGLLDHTAFFPIALGQTHDEITCAECHTNQADRTQLSCADCHEHEATAMADAHGLGAGAAPGSGVPGYLHESGSCFLCHQNAEVPGVMNHEPFFPIAPPAAHEGLDCNECHTDPGSRSIVECINCHLQPETDPIHSGVGGYTWTDVGCKLCHPNAEPVGLVDHTNFFPIEPSTPHENVGCTECHTDPTDLQVLGCAGCHATNPPAGMTAVGPLHEGVPGYAESSPSCLACHPGAINPGQMDHSPFFPIAAPAAHDMVTCADCHASQTDRSLLSCADCHDVAETATQHALVSGFSHESTACISCHPDGSPDGSIDHTAFFPIEPQDKHGMVTCAECHIDPNDINVMGCAQCHDVNETAGQHTAVPGFVHESPSCLTCHPYGDAQGLSGVDHAPIFPIDANTDHFGVGCVECHLDTADMAVNGCKECHEQTVNLNNAHGAALEGNALPNNLDDSQDCKKCHAEGQVYTVATHAPFRIQGGAHRGLCVECHLDYRADKPWAYDFEVATCIDCHEHRQSKMNDVHSDENGYSWTSPACIDCHPQGD